MEPTKNLFNKFLNDYFTLIYNYHIRMVKNKIVAEDLAQDTFLKAWLAFDRFDQSKAFKPWIFKIAHHVTIDYIRKNREIPDEFIGAHSEIDATQESQLIENEMKIKLENSLAHLPFQQREAVYLYYIEENDLQEVSRIMKKSRRGIISLLQRARKTLRLKLALL